MKRLTKEYQNYLKDPPSFIKIKPDEDDFLNWYFIIYNLQDEPYKNGVYLGKVKICKDYPFKPPVFSTITPSGRFIPDHTICTTFSHYHKEEWSPQWTIKDCLIGLASNMFDEVLGQAGGMITTNEEKKEYAENSMEFNKKNEIFVKYFSDINL